MWLTLESCVSNRSGRSSRSRYGVSSESRQRTLALVSEQLQEKVRKAQTLGERTSLLFQAVRSNAIDVVEELLNRDCPPDQTDETGGTALHWAASRGYEQLTQLLLDKGSSPLVRDRTDSTPLHLAADKGYLETARLLLDRGCPVDVISKNERTPLHAAARRGHIDVAQLLLDRGCSLDAQDTYGDTPFHNAVAFGHVEVAQHLLDRGFALQTTTRRGRIQSAIRHLLKIFDPQSQNQSDTHQRRSRERVLSTLFLLIAAGCSCEIVRSAVRGEKHPDVALFLAAIDGWDGQQLQGAQVSSIPAEVLGGTVQDLEFFFASLKRDGSSYRKKLCVVGPSSWGKTSFIKSLTSNRSSLERADTRTIGIDLFPWSFNMPDRGGYCDVSVWDFAGQDEYQSVHALFYSKRTLYVVCVSMEAYVDMLKSNNIVSSGESNAAVDAFFDTTIYSRIQAICAHEPASEFVFVGTKIDLVEDKAEWLRRVGDDIMERISQREADVIFELDRALEEIESGEQDQPASSDSTSATSDTNSKYEHLTALRHERPKFVFEELLAMSSADLSGLAQVKAQLQRCIESSDSSFLMPWNFAVVGQCLRAMVQKAEESGSLSKQLSKVFVPKDKLCEQIKKECEQANLNLDDVESILRTFHALGDILWFEKADSRLRNIVFLSPDLVIDFIRKVINHELGDQSSSQTLTEVEQAVRNEGRVAHSLLKNLDLWRDVKDKTVTLQLKRLLFNFQLAYPEGSDMLCWNSDLIVPTYWRKASPLESQGAAQDIPEALSHHMSWEYEFRTGLPDSLFDKLGVRSYSASYSWQRAVTRTSFTTKCTDKYVTEISKLIGGGEESACPCLRIRVFAANMLIAWKQWLWYITNLEQLLEEYPGLWIVRYAVSADGTRGEVDKLLEERRKRNLVLGMTDVEQDTSTTSDLLPPTMSWFENKEWNALGKMDGVDQPQASGSTKESIGNNLQIVCEMIMRGFAAQGSRLDVLQQTVIQSASEHKKYPGLWTLTHRANAVTSEYELKLLSSLSGKCHHEPIIVTVANPSIFGKHGDKIKVGLSLMCACLAELPGKGVADFAVSAAKDQIDRSKKIHGLVGQLDVADNETVEMHENLNLLPDENVRILRELLKLKFDAFDPLMMSGISNLVCGFCKGYPIWAHKDEIAASKYDIIVENAGAAGPMEVQPQYPENTETLRPVRSADGPSAMVVVASAFGATLEILSAQDLPSVRKVGVQSPYCKWKLLDAAHKPLATGKTPKHVRGGRSAEWKYESGLSTAPPIATLAGCSLVFIVKTEMMISSMRSVIAEGSHTLSEKEVIAKPAGQPSEIDVRLLSRGEFAGLLKFRLRFT